MYGSWEKFLGLRVPSLDQLEVKNYFSFFCLLVSVASRLYLNSNYNFISSTWNGKYTYIRVLIFKVSANTWKSEQLTSSCWLRFSLQKCIIFILLFPLQKSTKKNKNFDSSFFAVTTLRLTFLYIVCWINCISFLNFWLVTFQKCISLICYKMS